MKSFLKNVLSTVVGILLASILCVFILIAAGTVLIQSATRGTSAVIEKHSILNLRMRGELVDKHRPLDFQLMGARSIFNEDHTIGLWELTRAIQLAKKDPRIDGIYLEMRDFDSGWASLTALHDEIEDFKTSGKWVYSYADHYDEKSYYLATAASKIFIQPHGEVQFNGLSMSEPFVKGLLDKLDVQARVFRVGKFKAAVEPLILDHMSPENRKQNEDLLGDIWSVVRKSVATAQKLEEKRVDEIAGNLLAVSAEDAKKVGLLTELIFEDELEDTLKDMTIFKDSKKVAKGQEKDREDKDNDLRFVTAGQLNRDSKSISFTKSTGKKKIAVIFAEGEINSGIGGRDSVGSESFREDLQEAREDEDVSAIVVRINSPGGDALASDVIWREMMITDEEIPVVVSMGDVAASGGYYMASAGRYIFAEPTTITGSIGVFGLMFNTEKFFKNKTYVNFDRVVTHPYADIGDSNRPMTPVEAQSIQSDVNRVYKRFLDVVQEGRGYERRQDLENIAEGRVWSGKRAVDLGLVDELGGLDAAFKKAAEYADINDYKVEIYPRDSDPIIQFLERFSGDAIETWLGPKTLGRIHTLSSLLDHSPVGSMMKPGVYARLLTDYKIH